MKKAGLLISLSVLSVLLVQPLPATAARPDYSRGLEQSRKEAAGGNFSAAERILQRLARNYPNNAEIEAALGRLRLWQHDYAGATRLLRLALSHRKDDAVRQDLLRAETLAQIADVDAMLAIGNSDAAEPILRELFEHDRLPYESGSRLGRLYQHQGQPGKARAVYLALRKTYPAEADFAILAAQAAAELGQNETALAELTALPPAWQQRSDALTLQVRLLASLGRLEDASGLLRTARERDPSPELRERHERLTAAIAMRDADSRIAAGQTDAAEALLRPLWDQQATRYDAGIRLGRLYLVRGESGRAAGIYAQLAADFPAEPGFTRLHAEALAGNGETKEALALLDTLAADPDILALRGRLLYRLGELNAAVQAYRASLAGRESAEVAKELAAAETAALLTHADRLSALGDHAGAITIWKELESSGRDTYTAGHRLATAAVAARDFPEARRRFAELTRRYPHETGFRILYLESLIQTRDEDEARRITEELPPAQAAELALQRPDLVYRIRRNSLRLAGGLFAYSGGRSSERNLTASVSQRLGPMTGVVSASHISRFGLTDTQAGIELHAGLRSGRAGYLAATVSPDSEFLARYTAGGEFYQGWRSIEGSLGFFRLSFRNSDAHILIPGLTWHATDSISVGERVYVVLDTGAVTALTTLAWEPDHRFRSGYSIGIGSAAERFTSSDDTTRYFTMTNRLSAEYRFTPAFSAGCEVSSEYRKDLYTRTGGLLFARYWW